MTTTHRARLQDERTQETREIAVRLRSSKMSHAEGEVGAVHARAGERIVSVWCCSDDRDVPRRR
jgi:hypothetical protein